MKLTPELRRRLIEQVAATLIEHAGELGELDRAIGDGDHGVNIRRGMEGVVGELQSLIDAPLPEMLAAIGMRLVMSVGGASGALYGTLMLSLAKTLPEQPQLAALREAFHASVAAVAARGKAQPGQKTLLDVLAAVEDHIKQAQHPTCRSVSDVARRAADETVPMVAQRGRAAFLGARSAGHMDPGARSASLGIIAICDVLSGV